MFDKILGWIFALVLIGVFGFCLFTFPFQTIVVIILLAILGKK